MSSHVIDLALQRDLFLREGRKAPMVDAVAWPEHLPRPQQYDPCTMRSRLIIDGHHPVEDEALMNALDTIDVASRPDGVQMIFGVEDSEHRVYRLIETSSLIEAVSVIGAIRQFGLSGAPGRREHGVLLQRVFVRVDGSEKHKARESQT
ncbi:hypothetical protein [Rhizobacter sp. P5_C2]